jgi:iron complex outermembrane receptor protein
MNTRLLAKASLIALAAGIALPQAASAQGSVGALRDEILVTATKKADAENVQDVPLAITAYGADQLDALKVRDLGNLSYSMPNVGLEDIGTSRGVANFSIRGLATNSSIPSIDPAVATFVDGVYLGQNAGVVMDIFDLESVEVLRGPQGILFGRNVTGGAVLLNTKKPNMDEFEMSFKGALENGFKGTGNNYYLMGSMSGPLVDNTLAFKLSAYYNNDRGYFKRYLPQTNQEATLDAIGGTLSFLDAVGFPIGTDGPGGTENFGKAETYIFRPQFLWTPSDSLEIIARFERFHSEGQGPASQNHPRNLEAFQNLAGQYFPSRPQSNPLFTAPKDSFIFSIDEPGYYEQIVDAVTVEANLDVGFGDGVITNIFGWRDSRGTSIGDIDATPFFLFHSFADNELEQLSNEIRYSGRFFDRVDVTTGFYYYDAEHKYQENRFILGNFRTLFGGGLQDSRNYGIFGQFDWDLSDTFTFIAGGRWTNEKKSARISNITLGGSPCSVILETCTVHFTDENTWKNFTPKVGFQWDATDFMNVYGHWSQGIRSGGYNFRNTSVFLPIERFEEEKVNAYELGFKAQPADGRVQINAAFFINDISDMQREINLPDPAAGVVQLIRNTADATIFGIEIEGQYFVTDNLVLQGHVGHLNGDYDKVLFNLNSDCIDVNGNTLCDAGALSPFTLPEPGITDERDLQLGIPRLTPWTYGAGFVHSASLGGLGELSTRFSWSHRDDTPYTDNNLGILQGADIIDSSISLALSSSATLSVYGQNLLDEVTHGGETQLPLSIAGGTFAPLNKGRIVGIELQLDM